MRNATTKRGLMGNSGKLASISAYMTSVPTTHKLTISYSSADMLHWLLLVAVAVAVVIVLLSVAVVPAARPLHTDSVLTYTISYLDIATILVLVAKQLCSVT
jgi:hypothetical protein